MNSFNFQDIKVPQKRHLSFVDKLKEDSTTIYILIAIIVLLVLGLLSIVIYVFFLDKK